MDPTKYKILIIDDEEDILEFLSYNLKKEGYAVSTAPNGREGIELAKQVRPHVILLDVMMPGIDGIETCEELRRIPGFQRNIIAFLTARSEDYSQIAGFEAGGDDYISKPIRPKVLLSRLKALIKRYEGTGANVVGESDERTVITLGNLEINREKYLAYKDGEELILPKKEFELLSLLISKPDKVFTRDEIFKIVWGNDIIVGDRTIDVHIRKLREKIGDDYIKTVKGVGYKFVSD